MPAQRDVQEAKSEARPTFAESTLARLEREYKKTEREALKTLLG